MGSRLRGVESVWRIEWRSKQPLATQLQAELFRSFRVPLHAALALRKKVSLESRPFSKGARKDKKGADGLTPLDRARKAGSQWAVEALTP